MQKFRFLAKIGFNVTLIGAVGHEVALALSMPYSTYKVLDWNLTGLLVVAFVISLVAVKAGRDAKVSFKEGRGYYVLLALSIFVSGCELAVIAYGILRRLL
jgi:hypothetical protein